MNQFWRYFFTFPSLVFARGFCLLTRHKKAHAQEDDNNVADNEDGERLNEYIIVNSARVEHCGLHAFRHGIIF